MKLIQNAAALLVLAIGITPLHSVEASGSGGYGGGSFPSTPRQPKPVDVVYEHGKSLNSGRNNTYRDVRVCVTDEKTGKLSKVKKKHLKSFKKGSAQELATVLLNCNQPDQKISEVYKQSDLSALIHYFNKRYKLRLAY